MANSPTSYFQIIRKMSVAFAGLFKNITIVRTNPELGVEKVEDQRIIVPIEYADKEKYTKRLLGDPDLKKKIQISLPRLSYEFVGLEYDASRKLNTNNKNFAYNQNSSDSVLSQYNPVPYDFNFQLTAYTRTIEDATQIVEYILPFFTPDFSIKVNLIPEMGITKNIPVLLNKVTPSIESEGAFDSEVRIVMFTFDFTVKGFIFGAIKTDPVIKKVSENIILEETNYNTCEMNGSKMYNLLPNGRGNFRVGEVVYQGYNLECAVATGIVKQWSNNEIYIINIDGEFKKNQTITGTASLASYMIEKSSSNTITALTRTSNVNPQSANSNSNWTISTSISEI